MEPLSVFALDPYIWAFLEGNWLAITMALALLKGIAKITPGTVDDKITTLLANVVKIARKGGNNEASAHT